MKSEMMNRGERAGLVAILALGAMTVGVIVLSSGCSVFGSNAGPPSKFEESLFSVSNTIVPRVVTVTNTVPRYETNVQVQVVSVTNTEHQVIQVPVSITNVATTWATNLVSLTNFVSVPQLGPSGTTALITGIGGVAGAPFGVGGLVTTAIGGVLSMYLGMRNRALAGQATGLNQTAGALTQNIETLMEVLKTTPQGQAAVPLIKNYLMQHQTEAGVIEQVGALVEKYVDQPEAKASAEAILKAVAQVKTG